MSENSPEGSECTGFFIPYRYRNDVRAIDYPPSAVILDRAEPTFREWIEAIEAFDKELQKIGGDPPAPRFEQDWFARLDLAACYTIVRRLAPSRIVEVGSGHSTRTMVRAAADGGLAIDISCVDPQPRAAIGELSVRHVASQVGEVGMQAFSDLQIGDVLFIDSSHLAQPGTDVDFLLNVVVPQLPSGVIVHIHDIFLPDSYPEVWDWRGYNEQLIVAAMLTSCSFEPLFASQFILRHTSLIAPYSPILRFPIQRGALETSLWLRKLSDAVT